MRLGIVIPALNEQETIAAVVEDCRRHGRPHELRVVVCDNGSADATAERAAAAGAEVVREPQRGYGAACLRALDHLGAWPEALAFVDADGSSDLGDLPALVAPLEREQADLVLGRRLASGPGALTLAQRFGNALTCVLLRVRYGATQGDLGPFRAITRTALGALHMTDRTWGWTVEMQIKALRRSLRVAEIPVRWRPRAGGQSKISGRIGGVIRAGSKILWTFARLATRGPLRPRPTRDEVLFFVKQPDIGQVKTRLAATIGDQEASRVYRQLARHCHRELLDLQTCGLADLTVCGSGAPARRFRTWLPGARRYEAQSPGDLGLRLQQAFGAAFARGARRVAAAGSDCPDLGAPAVSAAFGALCRAGAAVIPAEDGGYVLLALRQPVPGLFVGIDWSSSRVMEQTRRRAAALGVTMVELPPLADVDTAEDLDRVAPGMRDSASRTPPSPFHAGGRPA
jgi:rSAM/selenodomain-associated transferase 1